MLLVITTNPLSSQMYVNMAHIYCQTKLTLWPFRSFSHTIPVQAFYVAKEMDEIIVPAAPTDQDDLRVGEDSIMVMQRDFSDL